MEKTNNLIETWMIGAKAMIEAYEKLHPGETNLAKEKLQTLAKSQLEMINDARPNQNLPLEEQNMTQDHKEFIEFIKKVAETGELPCQF